MGGDPVMEKPLRRLCSRHKKQGCVRCEELDQVLDLVTAPVKSRRPVTFTERRDKSRDTVTTEVLTITPESRGRKTPTASGEISPCDICGGAQSLGSSLCHDHNHTTGQRRGRLCNRCNFGLGNFTDNAEFLRKAAEYLERWQLGTAETHVYVRAAVAVREIVTCPRCHGVGQVPRPRTAAERKEAERARRRKETTV